DGTGVRGARPTVPELTGCTYATFIKYDPLSFNGTEGTVGMDIDGYTNRFHELALLCLRMVEPEAVKVEQYIRGLTKSIRGDEATEGEKRKGKSDRGGHGDNRREHNCRQNQRRGNAGAMTNATPNNNETCQKCKNKRHAGDC
nr:hypothetical protein [Tanacetum cinerariifolium]